MINNCDGVCNVVPSTVFEALAVALLISIALSLYLIYKKRGVEND